jgi:DNA (cytosine-5)-methyltransferase 1|tara:strand:- start:765 stop:1508 length:744 start_codon:yes stop_codon:yes gene_type:complete
MMTVGSLFAGIGGFDLGLERAGMEVRWQVEIDPFCRKVLAKHWPGVKRYEDVREVGAHNLEPVELICGGFPCQDISNAGKREGITGARSGLWGEYARIIRELRPRYVIVENVGALLVRGIDVVLRDLAEIGYDAEWDVLSAAAVGAPHRRERVWIVAHPEGERVEGNGAPWLQEPQAQVGPGLSGRDGSGTRPTHWQTEPDVDRMAHGVPARVDRLRGLGNAVVPQVVEWIGHRIIERGAVGCSITT